MYLLAKDNSKKEIFVCLDIEKFANGFCEKKLF